VSHSSNSYIEHNKYPHLAINIKRYELTKKICLLGDPSVGKTSLIRRFVLDEFEDSYITTIGTKVTKKEVLVPVSARQMEVYLTLMIWDVAGQQEYKMFHRMYLKGVEGVFSVCDLTRKETVNSMKKYVTVVKENVGDVPIVFLFNKADLTDRIEVQVDDVRKIESYKQIPCYKTSAKSGENVNDAFITLSRAMVDLWLAKY
jgi:small GTP-binding protein